MTGLRRLSLRLPSCQKERGENEVHGVMDSFDSLMFYRCGAGESVEVAG